jgi:hypothetical protein
VDSGGLIIGALRWFTENAELDAVPGRWLAKLK